jgi:hypothetical protein
MTIRVTNGMIPVRTKIITNILGIISMVIGETSSGVNPKIMAKRYVGIQRG